MAVTRGAQYRLRAGAPMPVGRTNLGSSSYAGQFVLHTFGAERNYVDMYDCTTDLPASSEFRGQGLSGQYISASYSRLGTKDGAYFQGRNVLVPDYIEEDDYDLL